MDPASALFLQKQDPEEIKDPASCLVLEGMPFDEPASAAFEHAGLDEIARAGLARGGVMLIPSQSKPDGKTMAALRNLLWPRFHVPAFFGFHKGSLPFRLDLGGRHSLKEAPSSPADGFVAAAVRKEDALSPEAVTRKFDENACGWNGNPGSPTYGHFRWMRRIMAEAAEPKKGQRVLDAGCGAGWVGIEAGLMGASVSAFDPSPEMTRIAGQNGRELGLDLELEVGFTEEPPFPEPFEIVISSGVLSFSPDHELFFNGLDAMVRDGGLLVVGDVNPRSWGMRYRRRHHPVLPMRELNALPRSRVQEMLEARGYAVEKTWHYQLTLPVPQLMHLSEGRLGGWGCSFLLLMNRTFKRIDSALGSSLGGLFDSYIVRARKGNP